MCESFNETLECELLVEHRSERCVRPKPPSSISARRGTIRTAATPRLTIFADKLRKASVRGSVKIKLLTDHKTGSTSHGGASLWRLLENLVVEPRYLVRCSGAPLTIPIRALDKAVMLRKLP